MTDFINQRKDQILLVNRIIMMMLWVIFGWKKIVDLSTTASVLHSVYGMPFPIVSAIVAVIAELGFGLALLLGWKTRHFACALAFYTLLTAFIGHPYWNKTGHARLEDMEIFFKNIAIMGGVLMLIVTGAGRYSLDGTEAAEADGDRRGATAW